MDKLHWQETKESDRKGRERQHLRGENLERTVLCQFYDCHRTSYGDQLKRTEQINDWKAINKSMTEQITNWKAMND